MGHECPVCGQVCYCHGDIDDLILNTDEVLIWCDHCLDSWTDEDEIAEIEREIIGEGCRHEPNKRDRTL